MATGSAAELERALVDAYGPDFREKVIVNAGGSFALRDSFAECGLEDPRRPPPGAGGWGLFQFERLETQT